MNPGAEANHAKAADICLRIAELRSEGLTYAEVGRVLGGLSGASVKQRAYRARKYEGKK